MLCRIFNNNCFGGGSSCGRNNCGSCGCGCNSGCGCGCCRPCCPPCPPFPPFPPTPPTPPQPAKFLSDYAEAVGSVQSVAADEDVAFDVSVLDLAGDAITVDDDGKVFTINKAGLYQVEWRLNLQNVQGTIVIGLLENGLPVSAATTSAANGNLSNGALINVKEDMLPFTLSLHNFGSDFELIEPSTHINTATSIRILRFADGEAK